ncbi:tetratricopeptide repeat protein [Natranaerovirga pectinivora]|uniref:Tetratricopeptide repeat protein n=1 Tax=Natranaerovirga pectinivora TaxID=682400 RepID=A0A4R3MP05_9FIRM|nr:DnaJ domain-containing protein [Natranaerovirga pectinivora]TCT16001.1 tetratricopeptide repeat protein [Natranaerovirga pectinivora]
MDEIESLYEILQIDNKVDDREIKKAYVKMLRKYPPEKAPEDFKKIREAYERLIDPISRAEYDAFSQYKDQIVEHDTIGNNALESGDYKTAIKEYKKILIIEANLTFAKNKLGLALIHDGQYDAALVQFTELIKINPNNATFYSNLAYIYKVKLDYDKAEEAWLKAYELDSINDDIILALSTLYIDKEEYDKAIDFLKKCIGKNRDDSFQDFIYYFEMVKVYIFANDLHNIEKTICEIEKIIPDQIEAKEYVAWKFAKLAYELYEAKIYNLSEKISKRAFEINNSNKEIEQLYNNSKKLKQAFELCNLLSKDERILSPLKGPIFYYLNSDEYEEDELKENYDKNLKVIQSYIDNDYSNVIESIDILKRDYNLLYNYELELYEDIYRISQENKRRYNQWNNFKEDTIVINGIKRMVALWLSNDLLDEERDNYFKDIIKELDYASNSQIINSIQRVKAMYSELYKLNSDFLDELLSIATEKGNSSTISTITRPTSENSSNYINTSSSTSTYSNSSNSSNGGCGTIIICAIIGALIIPGIGLFIGAFIGFLISND